MLLRSQKTRLLGLLRRPVFPSGDLDNADILKGTGRVLLVKQSERMGNVILLNSAIDALSISFPERTIDLLLPAAYADLMDRDSRIGRIIEVHKREYKHRACRLTFTEKTDTGTDPHFCPSNFILSSFMIGTPNPLRGGDRARPPLPAGYRRTSDAPEYLQHGWGYSVDSNLIKQGVS